MVKTQQQETEMEKVLYETFLACKTAEDVKALLEDLCTHTETEQMAQRAKAAQLLKAGKTYTEVIAFMDAQEDRHEIDPFERMTKASPEHTVEEK